MAGRSFSASLPSSSQGSRLVRTFTKGNAKKALGPIETREFSEEMLSVVWVIDVGFISLDGKKEKTAIQGTGFCVNPEGYILSAAHLFPKTMTDILIRKFDDIYFRSSANGHVRLVKKFEELDVAVIKVEFSREGDENGFNYASFGDGALFRGQEVLNISHTGRWVYTSVRGEICFPCVNNITPDENAKSVKEASKIEIDVCTAWHMTPAYRKARDVVDPSNKNLNDLRTDLSLIQINNIHGFKGSSGSPVFNATGQIVGMIIFVNYNMDFAVHVSVLKNLLQIAIENDKKKKKQKQTNEKKGKRKFHK